VDLDHSQLDLLLTRFETAPQSGIIDYNGFCNLAGIATRMAQYGDGDSGSSVKHKTAAELSDEAIREAEIEALVGKIHAKLTATLDPAAAAVAAAAAAAAAAAVTIAGGIDVGVGVVATGAETNTNSRSDSINNNSKIDYKRIKEVFNSMDSNADGSLDPVELQSAMKSLMTIGEIVI
jgi:hypothetical protein